MKNGDLFTFGYGHIAARHWTQTDRRHPTSPAELPRSNRRRHPPHQPPSLDPPLAFASQNGTRSSRRTVDRRPGDPTSDHLSPESLLDALQHSPQTSSITECCDHAIESAQCTRPPCSSSMRAGRHSPCRWGRRGDTCDNAAAELFPSPTGTTPARPSPTTSEGFNNPRRRHSAIGYHSPLDYEKETPTSLLKDCRELSTKRDTFLNLFLL